MTPTWERILPSTMLCSVSEILSLTALTSIPPKAPRHKLPQLDSCICLKNRNTTGFTTNFKGLSIYQGIAPKIHPLLLSSPVGLPRRHFLLMSKPTFPADGWREKVLGTETRTGPAVPLMVWLPLLVGQKTGSLLSLAAYVT